MLRAIPVAALLVALGLGAAHLAGIALGQPHPALHRFFDLGAEGNLPTWFASVQWFAAAALLVAAQGARGRSRESWPLLALALLFLALSVDEVAQIHEWAGRKTDVLLPGGRREGTVFPRTGIWMFALGVPLAALFVALLVAARPLLRDAPRAWARIGSGTALALLGALGIELLSNRVVPGTGWGELQVLAEEMTELLGGTIVLWGCCELLRARWPSVGMPRAARPAENSVQETQASVGSAPVARDAQAGRWATREP